MIIFTPNSLIKSGDHNINNAELVAGLTNVKTVDANGWTKIVQKNRTIYRKKGTWSYTIGANLWTTRTMNSDMPVGIANMGSVDSAKIFATINDAAVTVCPLQWSDAQTFQAIALTNMYASSVACSGRWMVELEVVT